MKERFWKKKKKKLQIHSELSNIILLIYNAVLTKVYCPRCLIIVQEGDGFLQYYIRNLK